MATGWDAFISYSHAESERTAIALQRGLERFARPWYQRRAIRVFRDNSALSTNPALWPAIEQGLRSARQLIVLTSPTAAASAYVERETVWWVAHKGVESILLVRDAGPLEWTAEGRFSADSSITPSLRTAFADEPRWLDLRWLRDAANPTTDPRFAEAVADLSAPIRGLPRDELIGEDLVQHRRLRRLTRAAIAGLTLLLITSIVATVVAVRQRDDVLRQAVTLRSRQLAGVATQTLGSDLRAGQLLAVQSYLTEDSATTRNAVLEASMAAPMVQRFTTFEAPITALATAGSTVAVGLEDGRVYTLGSAGDAQPVLRWTAPSVVSELRVSDRGDVLLVRAAGVLTIVDGDGSRQLPGGDEDGALALSPSGHRAAVVVDQGRGSTRIVVFDTHAGARVAGHRDPLASSERAIVYAQYTDRIGFLDDATLRLVGNDNRWLTMALASGRVARRGSAPWYPNVSLYGTSSQAGYLLATPITAGQRVSVWSLDEVGYRRRPSATAAVQLTDPLSLAISPNGRRVLVNDSASGVSAAAIDASGSPDGPVTPIPGLLGAGAMEFTGNAAAVVAVRNQVAFLDLAGPGRGLSAQPLRTRGIGGVAEYASDARSSALAVSPDGTRLAVFDVAGYELEVLPTSGSGGRARRLAVEPGASYDSFFGPIWLDAATVLLLDPGGQPNAEAPPAGVVVWTIGAPGADLDEQGVLPLAAKALTGGRVLVALDTGGIEARQAPSGSLDGTVGAPLTGERRYDRAAFSADGGHVALLDQTTGNEETSGPSTVRVLNVASGAVAFEQTWPSTDEVDDVAFAGDTLLVSHTSGAVDVLADLGHGGRSVLQTAGNRTSTGSSQRHQPVIGPDGLIGFPTRTGLELFDLTTQRPIATVPVPPVLSAEPAAYAFSSDGTVLMSAFFGSERTTALVSFRPLGTAALVERICADAGGAIDAVDWSRLLGDQPPDLLACR